MVTIGYKIVFALCQALFHSLWLGFILIGVNSLCLFITNRSKPALRLKLYQLSIIIFLVAFLLIASIEFFKISYGENFVSRHRAPVKPSVINSFLPEFVLNGNLRYIINAIIPFAFSAWLVVVCFKISKLIEHRRSSKRIKKNAIEITGTKEVRILLQDACPYLKRLPVILLSKSVKSPLLTGFKYPTIVIPLELWPILSHDEKKAILLHELTHLVRKDHLSHYYHRLAEAIFFFNPALLSLTRNSDAEHENCCDDAVIEYIKNPVSYIRAITKSYEFCWQQSFIGINLLGNNFQVIKRVQRMIQPKSVIPSYLGILLLLLKSFLLSIFYMIVFGA